MNALAIPIVARFRVRVAAAGLWLPCAIVLAAAVGGALASTGNLMFIGAGLAALALPYVLTHPEKIVAIVIPAALGAGVIVSLAGPGVTAVSWLISLLSLSLLPVALVRFFNAHRQPAFLWLSLVFFLYCLMVTAMQWQSVEQLVAGIKRYFQGYGVLLALATVPQMDQHVRRWRRWLLAMAFLQLPFAIYEFVVLVPQRGGLDAGGEATDVVAGTFGANLEGGSSNAEMSAFLLIVLIFLLAAWRSRLIGRRSMMWMSLLCVAPLALGETKIVVVLLPLMMVTIYRKEMTLNPQKLILAVGACASLTLLLGYLYVTVMDRNTAAEALQSITDYNLGQVGYGGNLLNRMTALTFWWDRHDLAAPLQFWLGHGIGSAFWGDNSPLPGHIAVMYPNYGIGLTTASTLLWDTGVVGLLLHIAIFGAAWVAASRLYRAAGAAWIRQDALAIQAAIACFVVFIFYRDCGVNLLAYEIVVACVLGYLDFLSKAAQAVGMAAEAPASPASPASQWSHTSHAGAP
jgi:hypothetical protein